MLKKNWKWLALLGGAYMIWRTLQKQKAAAQQLAAARQVPRL